MTRARLVALARGLALASGLALAGCTTVGPNYHLPDKAEANAPAAKAGFQEVGKGTSADPLPARWWHLYDDPVLDALEEQALVANTDLRIAGANLARARAATSAAEGRGDPQFAADVVVEHARLSGESYLLNEQLPVANLDDSTVGVSYQIDLFGQIKRSVEAARADQQATALAIGAVKVTLAAEVARAYVTQCAAAEALDIATKSAEADTRALDIARRLQAAGRGSVTDVTKAEQRVAQVEGTLPVQRARQRVALYRLAFLMGRAPADYPKEAERCVTIPVIAHPLPVGDGAALIARRPDVRIAERRLAGATARIGVATAALYPQIAIGLSGGSYGYVKDIGASPAGMWSLAGLLHWTIPGKTEHARVRAANAEADADLARFDATVLGALRETETALATYAEDHNRAVSLSTAREAAERDAAETRALRAGGRSPLLATIGGTQGALQARAAESAAQEAVALDQVNLFLALGGGW